MMQSMSTERLEQGFRGGYAHLCEKVENAKAVMQNVISQAHVLFTMERELECRDDASASPKQQVSTLMSKVQTDVAVGNKISIASSSEALLMQNMFMVSSFGKLGAVLEQSVSEKEDSLNEECQNLKQQIASMKGSRDKLLFEIDRLSVELEFSETSRQLLEKQRKEQETVAKYWQQQADERHRQIERLKEMLDESAEVCKEKRPDEADIFAEVAKRVGDEHERHELVAKLVDSEQKNSQLRGSWLPALRSLEARLMELNSAAADAID